MKNMWMLCCSMAVTVVLCAQQTDSVNRAADSLYIRQFEKRKGMHPKLLHAEPLYKDLIRDLGARKGEKEWNFGLGLTDNIGYDKYDALVEYEWAPVNRLGLEIELPFTFYYNYPGNGADSAVSRPGSRLNSLKLASQWTFWVKPEWKASFAIGYLHEFLLPAFSQYGKQTMLTGHLAEPFFIAAKRWGNNLHTLLYSGPVLLFRHDALKWETSAQAHFNLHYMLPGTRNFVGIEANAYTAQKDFDMTLRPQMRLGLADNLLVGIVTGIPVSRENERMSVFIRLIYEPAEHNRHRRSMAYNGKLP